MQISKHVLPVMRSQKSGSIIHVSSVVAVASTRPGRTRLAVALALQVMPDARLTELPRPVAFLAASRPRLLMSLWHNPTHSEHMSDADTLWIEQGFRALRWGASAHISNGDRPVVNKANFTSDEWNKLLESVMMAGIAVTAADPSELLGPMKEGMTTGWALLKAKNTGTNELIKAVADGFGEAEGRTAARDEVRTKLSGVKLPEVKAKAIAALREAVAIVDAKAPGDAPAFKSWLQQIAQKTARPRRRAASLVLEV